VSCFILQSPYFAQIALTKELWERESDLSFMELTVISEMLFLFWRKLLLTSPYFILQNSASLWWNKINKCLPYGTTYQSRKGVVESKYLSLCCTGKDL